jgi:FMN-dependent NADH-azoreductase
MKLLHIDSSVLGPNSVSRQVSAAIVDRLQKGTPDLNVTYRDLTATPLAHLSGSHLAAAQGAVPEAVALQQDLAAGRTVLEEFLAADIVVIGAPMYNFTIPSQLKAWLDRILVAGKTFKYSAQGAEGLAVGRGRAPRDLPARGVQLNRHRKSRDHRCRGCPDRTRTT